MGKLSLRIVCVSLLCSALCGCETLTSIRHGIFGEPEDPIDTAALAVYTDDIPRVKPGVALIVQVSVSGQQSQKMDCMVDQNGEITLPYLLTAPVKCNGLTLDALRLKLVKTYQEFIKEPQVMVYFAQFDPKTGVSPYGTVLVLGEVVSPGPVNMPSTMDLTVLKVIQAAGGLRPFANKRNVQVTRGEKDGTFVKTTVDLVEIGEEGKAYKDMKLKAGDVVYVRETYW